MGEAWIYGTADPEHPGVARVLGSPARAVAGPIQAVVEPLGGMGRLQPAFTTGPLPGGKVAQPRGDHSSAGGVPGRPADRG